jgi:hypothetical protein
MEQICKNRNHKLPTPKEVAVHQRIRLKRRKGNSPRKADGAGYTQPKQQKR